MRKDKKIFLTNKKYIILISSLFLLIIAMICSIFVSEYTKKEKLKSLQNDTFKTNYPIIELICVSINENDYHMFDIDGNFYKANIKKANNISIGDVIETGGYIDEKNIYQIEDFKNDKSTNSYFKSTINLNIEELGEDWLIIENNHAKNENLWNTFIAKVNKKEAASIKIFDKTIDGDILSILFYDGSKFFVVEDDSRIWSISNNSNKFIYETKTNLEYLELNGLVLWYLTDTKNIGSALLENGELSSIVNGNSSATKIDMFWLWTNAKNSKSKTLDVEPWTNDYEHLFPTFELEWKSIPENGETFVIGEGDSQLVGTIGGKNSTIEKEKIELTSAIIKKEYLDIEKDVVLKGIHPLSGDLSNVVATCKVGDDVTINIKNKNNDMNAKIILKLWYGSDIEKYDSLPFLEQDLSSLDTFTLQSQLGVTFGEISYTSNDYIGTWNFTINGKE